MKRLPDRLLLINLLVEKSVGGLGTGCFSSGCEATVQFRPTAVTAGALGLSILHQCLCVVVFGGCETNASVCNDP